MEIGRNPRPQSDTGKREIFPTAKIQQITCCPIRMKLLQPARDGGPQMTNARLLSHRFLIKIQMEVVVVIPHRRSAMWYCNYEDGGGGSKEAYQQSGIDLRIV
eukprot:TRINITY_DN19850_c0_g1_i1.p1 TRINITY_DN19850_c0_g1~~TRINITY_DN19850_c0_g1_i1.p1  ORF type:complete len:103 (-),score=21.36 TRINITY_DN19850_c0_g1_i1:333-641(-)